MSDFIMSKEYLAVALLKAKYEIFRESFITKSELNQFNHFIQQEFNNRNLGVVIASNSLSSTNFKVVGEVIMLSDGCRCDLDQLSPNVSSILNDISLIANFFIRLGNEKLTTLENIQVQVPKVYGKKNNYCN